MNRKISSQPKAFCQFILVATLKSAIGKRESPAGGRRHRHLMQIKSI